MIKRHIWFGHKNMKKTIHIILLIILSFILGLFLLSCSPSPQKLAEYNFKQGVAELEVGFLKNAPPEKIYPNSNFKLVVELNNQEAYDISEGRLSIVNVDPRYFDVQPLEQAFSPMMGRSLIAPAGERQFLEFEGKAGTLFENADRYVGNYFLSVNYKSAMEFTDTVCINPKLYEVYDSGCSVEDLKSFSGQGAPLAVAQMEEIISPGTAAEVEFRLLLRNRGSGKVKQVWLGSARLGNEELDCAFVDAGADGKTVELKDNQQETILLCSKKYLRNLDSYTTTLFVDFTYDYEMEIPHRLTLLKSSLVRW